MRTLLQYLGLILVAILVGMPVWWAINTSLQPLESVYSSHFQIWPDHPQWSNYTDAVSRLPFLRFLFNSLIITTTAVFGTVLSTSMAGYVFARLRWTGRSWCFGILMGTLLIPSQVYLIPHFLMFERLGWLNTYKPLIVPGFLAMDVFYVFLFRQFFRSVPLAYTEAALVDGATHWTIYRRILLPMSKPVVITVIVMNAVYTLPSERLSDFLNVPKKFIPVTQASIYQLPGRELVYRVDFLNLNVDYVSTIFPKPKE